MAQQQPKKKNVAALSYSSLHEKLGKANRENRVLTQQNINLLDDVKELEKALDQMKTMYYNVKNKSTDTISKLQMGLCAAAILIVVLLSFTVAK